MHGNVWEWCEDWLGEKLHVGTDPTGETSSSYRMIRGGDWSNNVGSCRAAHRVTDYLSSIPGGNVGFRPALIAVP
jgi:sulfatase modifying factor 1